MAIPPDLAGDALTVGGGVGPGTPAGGTGSGPGVGGLVIGGVGAGGGVCVGGGAVVGSIFNTLGYLYNVLYHAKVYSRWFGTIG